MVSSIQGFGSISGSMPPMQAQALTDEQKSSIESILSEYDPENITAEDAQSIFESFREAGIRPGPGMKEAIEAAGFDAEELRSLGMPEGSRPAPPSQAAGSSSFNVNALQSLQTILSNYDLSNLSTEDQSDLIAKLNEAGLMESGYMIDLGA
ncbi:MAG: hypothetical protein GYA17_09975 [Chloroflexi bacterium]|nr:hypothetical protein [Chloroflexota bacterium]